MPIEIEHPVAHLRIDHDHELHRAHLTAAEQQPVEPSSATPPSGTSTCGTSEARSSRISSLMGREGKWSGWYVPDYNDYDDKYFEEKSGNKTVRVIKRMWSYFAVMNHSYIICK
jgi:hypothetical protein